MSHRVTIRPAPRLSDAEVLAVLVDRQRQAVANNQARAARLFRECAQLVATQLVADRGASVDRTA